MKGDATCHTTNAKFREGYDAINWSGASVADAEEAMNCTHEPRHDLTTAIGIMACLGALKSPLPNCTRDQSHPTSGIVANTRRPE